MRRGLRVLASLMVFAGAGSVAVGGLQLASPPAVAAASNGYGPGDGPQHPTYHWGGAYVLQGVPGYGYCIQPGDADPVELPWAQWYPVPYPGSPYFSNGQMAALAYFAQRFQGTGFDGYSVNDTVAAIAEVAYASAGGRTPLASQAPSWLVADLEAWITTFAGPWTITVSMNPPSGSTFRPNTNYSGTVTVRSATGAAVEGLELTPPGVGGPGTSQITNFVWLQPTTNAAGSIGFQWNIGGIPPGGTFSEGGIGIVGGAPGAAPPAYAAPSGDNGQMMLVSGSVTGPQVGFNGSVQQPPAQVGTISVKKAVPDGAYYGPGGAVFQIRNGGGQVLDTLTTNAAGTTPYSTPLPVSGVGTRYDVHEATAPTGYGVAPDQTVTVYPGQDSAVHFTGADAEPVRAAELGANKVDAQTGQPLAGAVFDFRFDSANNGVYDVDLGRCTTTGSGTCQPPEQNAPGGWLPGWYQVTEVQAPPGYWLDPSTAVQHVYLQPGAAKIASVTFADSSLGSLQLQKSGNDTSYWPVTGAVFTVTGPAPSTATVGSLVVGASGSSGILTGLEPGTYTLTETTAPPGYSPVPPFTAVVSSGQATTEVTTTDPVHPGSLSILKTDATTGAPLAGAVFDTRYDSQDNGTFDVDLGACTTDASGSCSPPPNDGTGFLPGQYDVTEVTAPPGYVLPNPAPSQVVVVDPTGTATFSFADERLVAASFVKVATGAYNPTQLVLAGAVINVTAGTSYGGPVVASCTTTPSGSCTTSTVLIAGKQYCWKETTAPPGLEPGASGCFKASESQQTRPITVTDPGLFVAIAAKKVDASDPSIVLAGAVFDLYRKDGGAGPSSPQQPADAITEPGQTWVARASSAADGIATFPLQFPGYSYCIVEHQAPQNYVTNSTEHCTGVLTGSPSTPPVVTTITVPDEEAHVTLTARKYNSAAPDTAIPGATYDLFVVGQGPPAGPPSSPPSQTVQVAGDTWWARGTTTTSGVLSFTVPAGYAWCLREVSAPPDYAPDPALHCTSVLDATASSAQLHIALPETTALVSIFTHKFNAKHPNTAIPGATYELVGEGSIPPGWSAPANPNHDPVPTGDWFVGTATTGTDGVAGWSVPAGHSWCIHELHAPAHYRVDTAWHCTGVVTRDTSSSKDTVALAEVPVPTPETSIATSVPTLPFTGGPGVGQVLTGLLLALTGGLLLAMAQRRQRVKRATAEEGSQR